MGLNKENEIEEEFESDEDKNENGLEEIVKVPKYREVTEAFEKIKLYLAHHDIPSEIELFETYMMREHLSHPKDLSFDNFFDQK